MSNYLRSMESPKGQPSLEDCCYNFTTGYLEDALIQFSFRLSTPQNSISASSFHSSDFNLWTQDCSFLSREEEISRSTNLQCFSESKSMEEVISIPTKAPSPYNSPGCIDTQDSTDYEHRYCFSTASSSSLPFLALRKKEKRRRRVRVVYPFALVKPGGIDGDLTLEDINKRIMMAPSRAVRHPVGDYACRPCVASPHGPGLSGKAVVALTRIHTQGSGSITIVRTKD
ncbi:hypothetical protein V2J09_016319 [Rumex salicifolius]